MLFILITIINLNMTITDNLIINFGLEKDGSDWRIINDDVMGGKSQSEAKLTAKTLYFKGNTSLENNGGFVSIRSPFQNFDLSAFETVTILHKGTNRSFSLVLETEKAYYLPYYKHDFKPSSEEWETTTIKLNQFKKYRFGQTDGTKMNSENLKNVIRIGCTLFDKQAGDFELEIESIEFN